MSGYDYEPIDTGAQYKELECHVCFLLIKDAVELDCGHSLCSNCLDGWQKKTLLEKTVFDCPQCKEPVNSDQVKENKTINRIIRHSLKIKCKHHKLSCDWTGCISDINDHLNNTCKFVEVECCKCGMLMFRNELDKHLNKNCIHRIVVCKNCGIEIEYFESDKHNDECPKGSLSCPNPHCDVILHREELENHQNNCEYRSIKCDFYDAGCVDLIPIKKLTSHMEISLQKHLYLLHKQLQDSEKTRETERKEMECKLERTRQQLSTLSAEFQEYKEFVDLDNSLREHMSTFFSQMKGVHRKMKEEHQQLGKNIEEETRRFDESFKLLDLGNKLSVLVSKLVDNAINKNKILVEEFSCLNLEERVKKFLQNHTTNICKLADWKAKLHFECYQVKYRELIEKVNLQLAAFHDVRTESMYLDRFRAILDLIQPNKKILYDQHQFLVKLEFLECYDEEWSICINKKTYLDYGCEKYDDVHVYKTNKNICLFFDDEHFARGIPLVSVCNPRQLYKLQLPPTKDDFTSRINFTTLRKSSYVMDGFILLRITKIHKGVLNITLETDNRRKFTL